MLVGRDTNTDVQVHWHFCINAQFDGRQFKTSTEDWSLLSPCVSLLCSACGTGLQLDSSPFLIGHLSAMSCLRRAHWFINLFKGRL